ncbi:DUF3164 family protein [Tenacibaculum maritimum]|uniref:DUF3164 family protein n=1 Tax=Tenacibaculum maritimum TaxID=107401 RepID=UPI0012E4D4EA|nr:DUF3164 family protein [Tenacibaculum maritimum]CAA0159411.1 conserved hypothetical protein [Tenacibaculum maritimum]CAA0239496.1 conserved hypothetical protein [Tenacibaculum maritimum]
MDFTKLTDEEFQREWEKRKLKAQEKQEADKRVYEDLKCDTIVGLSLKAIELNEALKNFKKEAFESLSTLYKLLQEYSSRHADGKGNFTIENSNYKISYKRQGKGKFDERAVQAERHILDFLDTRYSGDLDTKALIISLLERKNGALDINLIQKLYQMEMRFKNENWRKGIQLLKESFSYGHSKDYIIFEKRGKNGEWIPISLQFSRV